ncbi:MAG TPA: FGGY-family carbohydrate kinase [Vicinamibacterales bacterium]|nr:FGGY-family carbohydrate kinase [Vicinamibacterales bacterium]
MGLYLGLDCSTQGLTAIVIEVDDHVRRVVFHSSLNFDRDFPAYGTTGGVKRGASDSEVSASPLMWADALDRMMSRIARAAEIDLDNLRAIAGSAQQHGSVYLNQDAPATWQSLDPAKPLAIQLPHTHSRAMSPVWMDASTAVECREIEDALGGADTTAALTGSPACERFTGPQIRRFFKHQSAAYAATTRIHLVSSYLASLLAGRDMPIDPGDASGMNLMDLQHNRWSPEALDATAPGLSSRLPPIQPSFGIAGRLSSYWQKRYSLPAAPLLPWTGDNPSSLVGTGVIREGVLAVSLGTSDTVFSCTTQPAGNSSHVFRSPTGDFMNLVCFRNGSLAREWIRLEHRLDWADVGKMLEKAPGNDGCVMLPWLEAEITPPIAHPGLRRFGFDRHNVAANVRGLIEGQMMALANHAAKVSETPIDRVIATGGAAVNRAILQVMANVFGVEVYRLDVENSAALGAALRAYHADRLAAGEPVSWKTVVSGFTDPTPGHRVSPNPKLVAMYAELRRDYAILERLHKDRAPIC